MSTILEKIKELQKKQAMIDEYKTIFKDLQARGDHPEYPGIKDEILSSLKGFIDSKISSLETGVLTEATSGTPTPELPFSSEEVHILKAVVTKVASKDAPAEAAKPKKPALDRNDPLRFFNAYRHLEKKRVQLQTENGPVLGTVVELSIPNVVIVTDTGFKIPVDPDKLQIIGG